MFSFCLIVGPIANNERDSTNHGSIQLTNNESEEKSTDETTTDLRELKESKIDGFRDENHQKISELLTDHDKRNASRYSARCVHLLVASRYEQEKVFSHCSINSITSAC